MAWRRTTTDGEQAAGARLARQATASLAGLLAERELSRRELADRLGVSPGRVSQILSGDENLTLRTLAAVAECLGARVEITFQDAPETGTALPTLALTETASAATGYAPLPR
ncbi:helix-turn-helix domain-containing protein [Streptomyces orinoci]|uniref:Helix-turn-helix transcriptional regulator n=1 Tax=Streptomyces orinoci TaxID=67339 RepID=A0ABV3K850_STRON|nr:helix-turn-helix transcriptional regulator [Streptomyces orinoci]